MGVGWGAEGGVVEGPEETGGAAALGATGSREREAEFPRSPPAGEPRPGVEALCIFESPPAGGTWERITLRSPIPGPVRLNSPPGMEAEWETGLLL